MLEPFSCSQIEKLIASSEKGSNTAFLNKAHSLWYRFQNYDKAPPMVFLYEDIPVCCIFATYNRNKYTNLYEIVTMQGHERNGYASQCWDKWISYAVNEKSSQRLKLSCTPASIGWHVRNDLIFWAVDPSGSLRSDQRLFGCRKEQKEYLQWALEHPQDVVAELPESVRNRFCSEQLDVCTLSNNKKQKAQEAIEFVGDRWFGKFL
jgi:hypothetical protein